MKLPANIHVFFMFAALVFLSSCPKQRVEEADIQQNAETIQKPHIAIPQFNADSAFFYIEKQVAFGPRVPNLPSHQRTAEWLTQTLKRFADTVIVQPARVRASDGTILNIQNIIGSFDVENPSRVLLVAHWDTRPWADHDPDPANHWRPIPGANDGGSGVGVLLEVARQLYLSENKPDVGIDIILFDAEDYGEHESVSGRVEDSWGLGSQYWARNPHHRNYRALYGINVCMVGAQGARFLHERFSAMYAMNVIRKVWSAAHRIGYQEFFPNEQGGFIINDHYYINRILHIPTINIIHQELENRHVFFPQWHTMQDDIDVIDRATLKAVGQTLLTVVFEE
ncbi:MAG TPA: M28 family peptidase [Bacteroidales bacterium]|nr:M28 family peptidase [Bacteroidales bacterium]